MFYLCMFPLFQKKALDLNFTRVLGLSFFFFKETVLKHYFKFIYILFEMQRYVFHLDGLLPNCPQQLKLGQPKIKNPEQNLGFPCKCRNLSA